MRKLPLKILLTNDDGYFSNGIKTLAKLLVKYGDVLCIAPKEAQSGKATSITMELPLKLNLISDEMSENGNKITFYSLTGTPVDCVKLAMVKFYPDQFPDVMVSGINHGSNASAAAIYSGTLGAATEGTVYGIPSIGFSIDSHDPDADLSPVIENFDIIFSNFLQYPPSKEDFLNVNFPDIKPEMIKGVHFAAQGRGRWTKEFNTIQDPHGNECYWMSGYFLDQEERKETGDHQLVKQGYISIVPHKIDTTDYAEIERLKSCWKI
jgi:5'-nucleotidase